MDITISIDLPVSDAQLDAGTDGVRAAIADFIEVNANYMGGDAGYSVLGDAIMGGVEQALGVTNEASIH